MNAFETMAKVAQDAALMRIVGATNQVRYIATHHSAWLPVLEHTLLSRSDTLRDLLDGLDETGLVGWRPLWGHTSAIAERMEFAAMFVGHAIVRKVPPTRNAAQLVATFDMYRAREAQRAVNVPEIDAATRLLRDWWYDEGLPTTRDWREES